MDTVGTMHCSAVAMCQCPKTRVDIHTSTVSYNNPLGRKALNS